MAIQRWSSWATNYFNGDSTKDIWSAKISKWQYRDNLVGRLTTSVKDRWTPRFRDDLVGRLTTSTGTQRETYDLYVFRWVTCYLLEQPGMHIMISTEIQMTIHRCSSSTTSTGDSAHNLGRCAEWRGSAGGAVCRFFLGLFCLCLFVSAFFTVVSSIQNALFLKQCWSNSFPHSQGWKYRLLHICWPPIPCPSRPCKYDTPWVP